MSFPWPGGAKAALSLSWDDARVSQVDRGHPLLDRYGFKGSFYVNPSGVDQRLEGWKRAAAAGHEIGNHTLTHPCSGHFPWSRANALEDYTLDRMTREIDGATEYIIGKLGTVPVTFGYPCDQTYVGRGEKIQSYIPLVAKRFLCGRGALNMGEPNDPEYLDLAQVPCGGGDGYACDDYRGWAERAARDHRWMIFCGHEFGDDGFQTTRLAELERFLGWLKERGSDFWVGTVAEVASFIKLTRGSADPGT